MKEIIINEEMTISETERQRKWELAKSFANSLLYRLNKAKKKFGDSALFVRDGDLVTGKLIIDEFEIYIRTMTPKGSIVESLFENDPDYDHGLYCTDEEIKKYFDEFEIYVPYK